MAGVFHSCKLFKALRLKLLDYDPEDYGPVFAEMLEEKRKRQRNPEEKNEKSTM